jgi:GNAT superfamily N-acetyltransferase
MVTIHEASSKSEIKDFIKFPFGLYEGNPYWVPPIIHDDMVTLRKNPAFEHCVKCYWVAKKNGQIVGRIAGIVNRLENEKTGKKLSRFGWIEFIDDREVSAALFKTVENWARQQGMNLIHGPLGFTDLDREGMLIEGFNELGTFATMYNHPYYLAHLEAAGYGKSTDWLEYEIEVPKEIPARMTEFAAKVAERFELRHLEGSRSALKPYAPKIFKLINSAFKDLYGVVELSEKQIAFYTDQYFTFIKSGFVSIILNKAGDVIAFGLTMPSLSHAVQKAKGRLFPFGFVHILQSLRKNDRADFYLIAIDKEYQRRGVHIMIFEKILRNYQLFGIKKVETNPELETNTQVQAIWKDYNPRQHKRRRCFIKNL